MKHIKKNLRWLVPLLLLMISLSLFFLHPARRMDRLFFYYDPATTKVVLERHRTIWSGSRQKNICLFVEEQLLPSIHVRLVPLFQSSPPNLCIYRRGRLYLNFEAAFGNPELPYTLEEQLALLKRAIRANFHYLLRVQISITGMPVE